MKSWIILMFLGLLAASAAGSPHDAEPIDEADEGVDQRENEDLPVDDEVENDAINDDVRDELRDDFGERAENDEEAERDQDAEDANDVEKEELEDVEDALSNEKKGNQNPQQNGDVESKEPELPHPDGQFFSTEKEDSAPADEGNGRLAPLSEEEDYDETKPNKKKNPWTRPIPSLTMQPPVMECGMPPGYKIEAVIRRAVGMAMRFFFLHRQRSSRRDHQMRGLRRGRKRWDRRGKNWPQWSERYGMDTPEALGDGERDDRRSRKERRKAFHGRGRRSRN